MSRWSTEVKWVHGAEGTWTSSSFRLVKVTDGWMVEKVQSNNWYPVRTLRGFFNAIEFAEASIEQRENTAA